MDPVEDWPLFDIITTRRIEQVALAQLPSNTLMPLAGLAAARLALALAPDAQTVWIAAGPGNNGGDGLEASVHLHNWGKNVVVTWLGSAQDSPADAVTAWRRAQAAGVEFAAAPPERFDLCLDAMLGIGAKRAPDGTMAQWVRRMASNDAPVLAIDVPTGLNADTGQASEICVRATATLCLLTTKPGLFTADGRDASVHVWLDSLGVDLHSALIAPVALPCAVLAGRPLVHGRAHASHKGSYGDVAIVGGAPGLVGAALLAGSAALHCGAGRVFVALLDAAAPSVDFAHPELMLRAVDDLRLDLATTVCGCGGGDAVRAHLPRILSTAVRLVLDADALNLIAGDGQLQTLLRARARRNQSTVLTPHPLEAARLLGATSAEIQMDRRAAAVRLVQAFGCTVVLKGSGSVIAAPKRLPVIIPTGSARLATAGTGDVLAGAIGAGLAAGLLDFEAACEAVYLHGQCADSWPDDQPLTASKLAQSLGRSTSKRPVR